MAVVVDFVSMLFARSRSFNQNRLCVRINFHTRERRFNECVVFDIIHGVHILADQFSSSGMPAIYVRRFFFSGVRIFFLCTSVFSAVACITNQMMLIKRSQTMYTMFWDFQWLPLKIPKKTRKTKKHGELKKHTRIFAINNTMCALHQKIFSIIQVSNDVQSQWSVYWWCWSGKRNWTNNFPEIMSTAAVFSHFTHPVRSPAYVSQYFPYFAFAINQAFVKIRW